MRIEGLAIFGVAIGSYLVVASPIWLLVVLELAPDLAMIGYLAGPRMGSLSYNVVHTYTLATALGVLGFWTDVHIATLVALIWAVHIGADRLVGYALKFDSGFKDTHLSIQPAPVSALTESEEYVTGRDFHGIPRQNARAG